MNDPNTPVVGGGATQYYPQDRYGLVVLAVSKGGAKVTLAKLCEPSLDTGHSPADWIGGLPVWDHEYTEDELTSMRYQKYEPIVYAYRRDTGGRFRYFLNGQPVSFASARYYRNWATA
jgi:hypothetical protein